MTISDEFDKYKNNVVNTLDEMERKVVLMYINTMANMRYCRTRKLSDEEFDLNLDTIDNEIKNHLQHIVDSKYIFGRTQISHFDIADEMLDKAKKFDTENGIENIFTHDIKMDMEKHNGK